MKKLLPYLLLSLFLFNSMGYYVVYEFNRHIVRREARAMARNNPEKFIVLRIFDAAHHPDFKRLDKKEFRYKNMMYDIVSEETTGLLSTFICYPDSKEEKLISGFKKISGNKLASVLVSHIIDIAVTIEKQSPVNIVPADFSFLPYKESSGESFLNGYFRPPRIS